MTFRIDTTGYQIGTPTVPKRHLPLKATEDIAMAAKGVPVCTAPVALPAGVAEIRLTPRRWQSIVQPLLP